MSLETALDWAIWGLAALLILCSLLPLSKLPFGAIRGLAFPREQFLGFALLLAAAIALTQGATTPSGIVGIALMLGVAALQSLYIIKFTPIWHKQSLAASPELRRETDRQFSLVAANVKKSNRDYGKLIALVEARVPDIFMAIEVDQDWIDALDDGLGKNYDQRIDAPLDNGYGLCVMSKLPLSEVEVRELVTREVPSIRARVHLPVGEDFRLYVVHPEPPVIEHDTKGRDSEIAMVGIEAEKDSLPAVVTGDLNDVAWSTTTRRFQRLSGLLDPRVGRGMYNTFSATMPWMRWPLDHLFHDPQFRLLEMDRLDKIGSDHFPMWFVLALAETEAAESDPESADREEEKETKDMIKEERKRDRDPIGSNWEDEQN
ncbi:endonuclease/exonuclease/phosphatase family protein [Sulfitobacter sp. DSM 110093]|uniref:endonuclease/exonuclease/phosphatase family protein n=1 Tax=Sulfitobacter sp. DSM 110093 TaxID=2883127 RepID=UPI001FAC2D69|nr:endonuclease/exonuclease/phosphatase family protein [Sulfitobacter sp. DSM 110093]